MEEATRILVVDDEPDILRMLVQLLQMEGYYVEGAPDGYMAIHTFWQFRPQIMIVDIEMPHMDGIDLIRQIREHDTDTRIIVLSGRDVTARASEAQGLDVSDFLLKPCHPRDIMASVKKIRASLIVRAAAMQAEAALTDLSAEETEAQQRFQMWQKRQAELIQQAVEETQRQKDAGIAAEKKKKTMFWIKAALIGLLVGGLLAGLLYYMAHEHALDV